jgi:hypothetical protein
MGQHRFNSLFYRYVFALASTRYAGFTATARPYPMTTLPKRITDSRRLSQHNPLLYLPLPLLSLPKRGAFGKVSCMEKHWLLPQMTASLYLGLILSDEGKEGHGMPPPNPRDGCGQRAEGVAIH